MGSPLGKTVGEWWWMFDGLMWTDDFKVKICQDGLGGKCVSRCIYVFYLSSSCSKMIHRYWGYVFAEGSQDNW
jgi:hypothetical protein